MRVGCKDNHNKYNANCKNLDIKRFVPHPCYIPSCCDDHDDMCLFELYEALPAAVPTPTRRASRLALVTLSVYPVILATPQPFTPTAARPYRMPL